MTNIRCFNCYQTFSLNLTASCADVQMIIKKHLTMVRFMIFYLHFYVKIRYSVLSPTCKNQKKIFGDVFFLSLIMV